MMVLPNPQGILRPKEYTVPTANHRTRWTVQEVNLLEELWDDSLSPDENARQMGELLERTAEAVRQRHYELTWGSAVRPAISKELIDGKIVSTSRAQKVRPLGPVCGSCNTELPATGACDWC